MLYDKTNTNNNNIKHEPIDVNGSVTPISQIPVGTVAAHLWRDPKVSTEFLNDQLSTLHTRLNAAISLGNKQMVEMITIGMTDINAIIANRFEHEENS